MRIQRCVRVIEDLVEIRAARSRWRDAPTIARVLDFVKKTRTERWFAFATPDSRAMTAAFIIV